MKKDEVRLKIIGKKGNKNLSPDNFDIAQIRFLFDTVESLLYPDAKSKKNRPDITYIDKSSLELLELIDYSPKFDESYLYELVSRAAPKWTGIEADTWLSNVR